MSKAKRTGRAWFYDPKTGKGRIFEPDEAVPKGWSDDPFCCDPTRGGSLTVPDEPSVPDKPDGPDDDLDMTVKQIKAELEAAGIPVPKQAKRADLVRLYEEAASASEDDDWADSADEDDYGDEPEDEE